MLCISPTMTGYRFYRRRAQFNTKHVLWCGVVVYGGVRGALGLRDDDGQFYMYRHHLAPLPLNREWVLAAFDRRSN